MVEHSLSIPGEQPILFFNVLSLPRVLSVNKILKFLPAFDSNRFWKLELEMELKLELESLELFVLLDDSFSTARFVSFSNNQLANFENSFRN